METEVRNSIERRELLPTGATMATAFGATLEAARGPHHR
jgi:hypothetical protein